MTTTNMARLNDMVRVTCAGALDGVIRLEMFNTVKDFFQRTDSWLLELPVYITPTTNDYMIDPCQNVIVNRLMTLERPRTPPGAGPIAYLPMEPSQFLAVSGNDNQPYAESQNPLFRVSRQGVLLNAGAKCPILRIAQNPNYEEIWIATLALNTCDPTDSDGFVTPPDWVMEKYLDYLASGTICRLMLQPGKPYSSMPGSQYHGRRYNMGVGLARTEVKNMFVGSGQHWRFPTGWNSRFRYFGSHTGYVG